MSIRQSITSAERKAIREYLRNNPTVTQQNIRSWFEEKYNQKISQSTICVSLSSKYDWLDTDGPLPEKQKNRPQNHPELEEVLYHAIQTEPEDFSTAKEIKAGAKTLWPQMYPDQDPPAFSNGWFDRFKKRYKVQLASSRTPRKASVGKVRQSRKSRQPSSSPFSSNFDATGSNPEEILQKIKAQVQKYNSSDVYSFDETSLFWKKIPGDGLDSSDTTKHNARITALLCCNGDGSDKLPLLLVGHEAKPRSFEAANVNIESLGCVWKSNSNASITVEIISAWLLDFDHHVARKGRKVVLLIDDLSVHKEAVQKLSETSTLQNTTIVFLPETPAFEMQPFPKSLFSIFKNYYHKRWLQYLLDELEEKRAPLSTMSVLKAIRWSVISWNVISPETITKSWYEAGLPNYLSTETQESSPDTDTISLTAQLFHRGHIRAISSVEDFINPEVEWVTDESIGDIPPNVEENMQVDDEGLENVPVISNKEALEYVERLFLYEEQQEKDKDGIFEALSTVEKEVFQRYREELKNRDVEPSLAA